MEKLNNVIKYDISRTEEMFHTYYHPAKFSDYDKVYYETNEFCDKIISQFDVSGKSVLTVLGSGDQAFQFYKNGAKNVDLFDINKLAIYYYYLRIWNIKTFGTIYPEWCFDNEFIKKLLKSIKPKSRGEAMAYKYWSKFIDKFDSDLLKRFFYTPYKDRYIYNSSDLNLLLDGINDNVNFFNTDISSVIHIPNKYDFIYTSNLSDYISNERIALYRNNLFEHLNDGGIVLCSNVGSRGPNSHQKRIVKRCFKYNDINVLNSDNLEDDKIGYCYTRRKIKRLF